MVLFPFQAKYVVICPLTPIQNGSYCDTGFEPQPSVPPGFRGTFDRFFRLKITDFAAAFLKTCGDIFGISYCFALKIYHGQHFSNIVITFMTSRTIIWLQTNI